MKKEYIDFLISIGIDPTIDEADLEEQVGDYLTLHCLDENYQPNEEGKMCYKILYSLS